MENNAAFKTIPASGVKNTQLVNSILDEMNSSDYADNLIASEAAIEPSLHSINNLIGLELSITPTAPSMMMNMQATDALLMPSIGNLNGLLNSPSNTNTAFGPQIDLNNPLVLGAALQNPALAAMYFGLQQLSQQATQYSTVFKPTQVTSTNTVYATKTISFYDGRATRTRTITEPASSSTRVLQTTVQEVQPVINPQVLVQQAQLQRAFASQLLQQQNSNNNVQQQNAQQLMSSLFGPPPQQSNLNTNPLQNVFQNQNQNNIKASTVTESVTSVSTATSISTKVYTLIYNALSTKFRTVTSSSVFPTTVTQIVTKTIAPTAAFNFFG